MEPAKGPTNRKYGDVEGTATEVEDQHVGLLLPTLSLLVQSVGNSGGSGLVDDA